MRARMPSASPAAGAGCAPDSEGKETPRKRQRPTPEAPPTAAAPAAAPAAAAAAAENPPKTAADLLRLPESDALAELMLAVPAPRIELPPGIEGATQSDAAAAALCRALLDKARTLKHSGDAALQQQQQLQQQAGAAPALWDGRALSFYVCAAVTYVECSELVQRLALAGVGVGGAGGGGSSAQQQQQQQQRGELARLAAQLRPQLMAQTATLCHAAAAGARQRLARLLEGEGSGEAAAPLATAAAAEASRRQYRLYGALSERLAAVCHLRHVAAQALVLRADVRLCSGNSGGAGGAAGASGGVGGGGAPSPPPAAGGGGGGGGGGPSPSPGGGGGATPTSAGGPLSSQHRLADAAQHTMRALDLFAGSSRALREQAALPPTRACPFSSAAVAHVGHVGLDLGAAAPGGGGSDVFRLAARARAALGCIQKIAAAV